MRDNEKIYKLLHNLNGPTSILLNFFEKDVSQIDEKNLELGKRSAQRLQSLVKEVGILLRDQEDKK